MISLLLAASCVGGVGGDLCDYMQTGLYSSMYDADTHTAGVSSDIVAMVEDALQELDDETEETTEYETEEQESEEALADTYAITLLAKLITAEQGYNASDTAYYYTGSVVLNRVASDDFPDTLEGVIYQRYNGAYQYQCVSNGQINRDYDPRAYEIAEDLLTNGSVLPASVVFQAEFRQGSGTYCVDGNTYYCYK